MKRSFLVVHIILWGIVLTGCADRYVSQCSTGELVELVADREQADRVRLGILAEVSGRPLNGEQQKKWGGHLSQIARSPLHSPVIRQRVIDMIAAEYPDEAPIWLSQALIETQELEIRLQILGHLERFKDRRALPGLIVAFSEHAHVGRARDGNCVGMAPAKTIPKLEDSLGGATQCMPKLRVGMPPTIGDVIVRIADDSLENVLAFCLSGQGDDTLPVRNAALLSLVRICGKDYVKQILSGVGEGDAFLQPLCFWAENFAHIPGTKSEVLMCQMQWLRLTAEQKTILQQRVRLLREREGYSFQIADSYILLEAGTPLLAEPGDVLSCTIDKDMRVLEHTKRPASYRGAADDYREDFIGQCNHLSYTDLLRIRLVLLALQSEVFSGQLRQHLQADLADMETEVGGLSFVREGTVELRAYPSFRRLGDNQYHESPEMIAEGTFCLARWHCHAGPHQDKTAQTNGIESQYAPMEDKKSFYSGCWKGAALAGPGVDDMEYVKYFHCPLLVVTYIASDTFSVDYVSAEGVVIDLGNY